MKAAVHLTPFPTSSLAEYYGAYALFNVVVILAVFAFSAFAQRA